MFEFLISAGLAMTAFALFALGRHDWLRLTRPKRHVLARVSGHRCLWNDGSRAYAPVYSFDFSGTTYDVVDQLYQGTESPAIGTPVDLQFPEGHPHLARPPRPVMWICVYATLIGLAGVLVARGLAWI